MTALSVFETSKLFILRKGVNSRKMWALRDMTLTTFNRVY